MTALHENAHAMVAIVVGLAVAIIGLAVWNRDRR